MTEPTTHFIISHAQNREDIILSGFFTDIEQGTYIDVGANDPNIDSVTKLFYERGWSGVNIEPIRRLYEKLEIARPRDINLNLGISTKKNKAIFREYGAYHGLSSFDQSMLTQYDQQTDADANLKDYKEYEVDIVRLEDVFKKHTNGQVNFLKVDVEGYEYEVLNSNDWQKYRPQVICIEANHITKDWRPILRKNGYAKVFFDGLNDYYVAEEAHKIAERFSYVQTMLPTPIIDYRVVGIIEHYKKEKLKADAKNVEILNDVYRTRHELHVAQEELASLKRLKGLTKEVLKKGNAIVEELIYPQKYRHSEKPRARKQSKLSLGAFDGIDSKSMLESLKQSDRKNINQINPSEHRLRKGAYVTYRGAVVGSVKFIGSGAKRSARKIKRTLNNE